MSIVKDFLPLEKPQGSLIGAVVQCGSRSETAREPASQSLLLSVPVIVPMSVFFFRRVGD